ncbi:hypothetical protein QBC44DRAFT_381029 [Cladorrhinum sp. PSN332]|nr:hypothetical protein QBC44DRAFT_381029 [Cladorrhinum sp. PSN332]
MENISHLTDYTPFSFLLLLLIEIDENSLSMPRLPPAEKLSLALRKNVRDEWDNNKADLEKQLSDLLGTSWTTDINPLAIYPYHNDGYAKESLGSCIKAYVEGAIYQIKYLTGRYENLKDEINDIAHAHVLTLDVEDANPARFSYCGSDVTDGKLRILFVETCLGTNVDYCLQEDSLLGALNAAPSDKPFSFYARASIRNEYEPQIAEARHDIAQLLGKNDDEVTLTPNFEDTFAKLQEASKKRDSSLREDWQKVIGDFIYRYFSGLVYQMKYQKVGEDELIQEGFLEAVSKNEIAFRIVDNLKYDSYCECDVEDGVLYLQTKAETFGVNIDNVGQKLVDRL